MNKIILLAAIVLTGCGHNKGNRTDITLYSGGKMVRCWSSRGEVKCGFNVFGFRDLQGNWVRVQGTVVVEEKH